VGAAFTFGVLFHFADMAAVFIHQLCQYFCHIIPSAPNQMLSMDECLRPLQAFCLDMQKKLDA
jgi:hypothetical protein